MNKNSKRKKKKNKHKVCLVLKKLILNKKRKGSYWKSKPTLPKNSIYLWVKKCIKKMS